MRVLQILPLLNQHSFPLPLALSLREIPRGLKLPEIRRNAHRTSYFPKRSSFPERSSENAVECLRREFRELIRPCVSSNHSSFTFRQLTFNPFSLPPSLSLSLSLFFSRDLALHFFSLFAAALDFLLPVDPSERFFVLIYCDPC